MISNEGTIKDKTDRGRARLDAKKESKETKLRREMNQKNCTGLRSVKNGEKEK